MLVNGRQGVTGRIIESYDEGNERMVVVRTFQQNVVTGPLPKHVLTNKRGGEILDKMISIYVFVDTTDCEKGFGVFREIKR